MRKTVATFSQHALRLAPAWAKHHGRSDCASLPQQDPLLQQSLDEDFAANKRRTALAEAGFHRKAAWAFA